MNQKSKEYEDTLLLYLSDAHPLFVNIHHKLKKYNEKNSCFICNHKFTYPGTGLIHITECLKRIPEYFRLSNEFKLNYTELKNNQILSLPPINTPLSLTAPPTTTTTTSNSNISNNTEQISDSTLLSLSSSGQTNEYETPSPILESNNTQQENNIHNEISLKRKRDDQDENEWNQNDNTIERDDNNKVGDEDSKDTDMPPEATDSPTTISETDDNKKSPSSATIAPTTQTTTPSKNEADDIPTEKEKIVITIGSKQDMDKQILEHRNPGGKDAVLTNPTNTTKLKTDLMEVLNELISKHPESELFLHLPTSSLFKTQQEMQNYYKSAPCPLSIHVIMNRVNSNYYRSSINNFSGDILKILINEALIRSDRIVSAMKLVSKFYDIMKSKFEEKLYLKSKNDFEKVCKHIHFNKK